MREWKNRLFVQKVVCRRYALLVQDVLLLNGLQQTTKGEWNKMSVAAITMQD